MTEKEGASVMVAPGLMAICPTQLKMAGVQIKKASISAPLVKKQTLADYVVKIFQQYRKI